VRVDCVQDHAEHGDHGPPGHLPAAEMGRLSAELPLASVPARAGLFNLAANPA
jgi:hypothetical protein